MEDELQEMRHRNCKVMTRIGQMAENRRKDQGSNRVKSNKEADVYL